jgi:hypothetical protein
MALSAFPVEMFNLLQRVAVASTRYQEERLE